MPSRAESPYASCGGTTSSRRPPFLIPLIPCSQPWMTLPLPSLNANGRSLFAFPSNFWSPREDRVGCRGAHPAGVLAYLPRLERVALVAEPSGIGDTELITGECALATPVSRERAARPAVQAAACVPVRCRSRRAHQL